MHIRINKLFVKYIYFWKSIFHAFQISSRDEYNENIHPCLGQTTKACLETSSKQDSLISASQDTESLIFSIVSGPRDERFVRQYPIPFLERTIPWLFNHRSATNSRTSRPEWNRICEMGFLQSQMWPPS